VPRRRAGGPAGPVVGRLDGGSDLVLGPSLTHHALDQRAKVERVRGCRQGSHCDPFTRLQGGGNADLQAPEPDPKPASEAEIEWLDTANRDEG
jgi:hypothetical protein